MTDRKVFVDTSVWIAYFRGKDVSVVGSVHRLIEDDRIVLAVPVWIELLLGVRAQELRKFRRILSALPKTEPSTQTWSTIHDWVEEASSKGQRFGFVDLLIAALCAESRGEIYSLDTDFVRMRKMGWIQLHE